MSERAVSVAVPLPLRTALTYRVPDGLPMPPRGARVTVPVGPRRVIGVVTGTAVPPGGGALKDLLDVIDEEPIVPPPLLDLCDWIADYYLAAPGECFRLALPPSGMRASRAVVRLLKPDAPAEAVLEHIRAGPLPLSTLAHRLGRDPAARLQRLRREGVVAIEQDLRAAGFRQIQRATLVPGEHAPRGKAQAEVIARLKAADGPVPVADLVRDRPSLRGALQRLAETGAVILDEERDVRTPGGLDAIARVVPIATADQASVLDHVEPAVDARRFAPFLLHGVTGSGKTEVYFRAAERALQAGRGVILLLPEIALTPFLVRAAVARFGATVAVQHSELKAGERHDQWWRLREGDARIVVGARSAVFAPLPDVGLIVVDEEHEASYKQEESPRYHARDVAVVRGTHEAATVLLGSATPSVESMTNARKKKYTLVTLPARIGPQGLPAIQIVDRRAVLKAKGDVVLTPPLLAALQDRLARGEQSLLLLNRRGYATSLLCRECGEQAVCPNCSVALTMHEGGRRALCHYCAFEVAAPRACAFCKGEYLRLSGFGTERVVERVRAALPAARVERLDRDLASKRGTVERVLAAFERGETDVLVGTQMIAKGHDFPRVTLVGVIDADVGLGMPDFRAAERTFQLLTQVAGRAGRADLPGEVILQSHLPGHYALRLACEQDYDAFFAIETEFRRTMGYPPVTALLNLVLRSRDPAEAVAAGNALAEVLRVGAGKRYRVLGPAHAPLARLREEHRVQVLLKGDRATMRAAVRKALEERRWPGLVVDVDPISVM